MSQWKISWEQLHLWVPILSIFDTQHYNTLPVTKYYCVVLKWIYNLLHRIYESSQSCLSKRSKCLCVSYVYLLLVVCSSFWSLIYLILSCLSFVCACVCVHTRVVCVCMGAGCVYMRYVCVHIVITYGNIVVCSFSKILTAS